MNPSIESLAEVLCERPIAVLTGAGISTESGIPDYRGEETRRRARKPIQFREFIDDDGTRRRYWARALVGWQRFSAARPNAAHQALAALERAGGMTGLITQNVDRLHSAAGSQAVVELHGSLSRVRCLECMLVEDRDDLQRRMIDANPSWGEVTAGMAPDGDADLAAELVERFIAPSCIRCEGPLKPDVVFFGESVPRSTVDAAWKVFDAAEALLVIGSSLAVFSGYRFVKRAVDSGKPVAIVNIGECRGQEHAAVKVDGMAGAVVPALVARLTGGGAAA